MAADDASVFGFPTAEWTNLKSLHGFNFRNVYFHNFLYINRRVLPKTMSNTSDVDTLCPEHRPEKKNNIINLTNNGF